MEDNSNEIVALYKSREKNSQISRHENREMRDKIQRIG